MSPKQLPSDYNYQIRRLGIYFMYIVSQSSVQTIYFAY